MCVDIFYSFFIFSWLTFLLQPLLLQPTMLCHSLASIAWSISYFAVGILCHHHLGCLQKPIQLFWHRHRLGSGRSWHSLEKPLRGRASESIINWFCVSQFWQFWGTITQLFKGSHQDKAPGTHSGDQLKNACLDWLSFLLFTILLHTHTPVSWNYFQSKPTASKPLSQTLPFEGTQDKTFDLRSRPRKQTPRKEFWNWIPRQSDTCTFGGSVGGDNPWPESASLRLLLVDDWDEL